VKITVLTNSMFFSHIFVLLIAFYRENVVYSCTYWCKFCIYLCIAARAS
jgi:hypothetical protein